MVAKALETVGLGNLGRRRPKELSGGQQQRVALARAMVYSPRVLLMDEPLGALDKKLRDSLQLEIKRIHAELGTTFVYVTHDQDEALVLSDRIAVFNNGRIEQIGSPTELYEFPNSLFVAQFLGESSLFHGIVNSEREVDANGHRLAASRGEQPNGTSVAVVVRPERIRIEPDGPRPDTVNAVPGRICSTFTSATRARSRCASMTAPPSCARKLRCAQPRATPKTGCGSRSTRTTPRSSPAAIPQAAEPQPTPA